MFTDPDGESVGENVAVSTGEGIVVVDVDNKNEKDGSASFEQLIAQGLPRHTFAVSTPSGGQHYYYRVKAENVYRQHIAFRHGIDIKSHHNYVNAPGSLRADGKGYEIIQDLPLAELPAFIADELQRAPIYGAGALETNAYEDEWALAAAIEYVRTAEPDSGPGSRHDALIRIGHKCFDLGLTRRTTTEVIDEHWPQAPEFTENIAYQIEKLAEGRVAHGRSKWGCAHPRARPSAYLELKPVKLTREADEGPKNDNRKRAKFFRLSDCLAESLARREDPLVRGLLDKGALSEWYGGSNTGKTFILLSLARAVAAGEPWAGKPTSRGLCIYFALEGGLGIVKRGAALAHGRRDLDGLPLYIVPQPLDLRSGNDGVKALLDAVKAIEAAAREPCAFLAIDTLSRALAGGDENSSADMGRIVQAFTAIQAATRAHVAFAHHTGKDESNGARGHSLLKGAVDTELYIRRGLREEVGAIENTKQRDMELAPDMAFRLEDVCFGVNEDGEPVKSAIAIVTTEEPRVQKMEKLSPTEQFVLDVFDGLGVEEATSEDWNKALEVEAALDGRPVLLRQNAQRARAELKRKGWIVEKTPRKWARK